MIKRVRETIKKYQMLEVGNVTVVAVSGGPDSVALLKILALLSAEYSLTLIAAHLNHGLRGRESDNEEEFVRNLSKSMGIEFERKYVDIYALRKERRESLEVIAREERYRFLVETAQKHMAHKIALGHHLQDQAETILMNFIRGSGAEGLKGILPIRDGIYIRPLIGVTRREIIAFLEKQDAGFMTDSSNAHDFYFRNRIRHHLIPALKNAYNPKIEESLVRMAEIFRLEDDYIKTVLTEVMSGWECNGENGGIRINIPEFLLLHEAIQNRAIKTVLQGFSPSGRGIAYPHIQSVIDMMRSHRPNACLHLPFSIEARREYGSLIICKRKRQAIERRDLQGVHNRSSDLPDKYSGIIQFSYPIRIPGRIEIPERGMTLTFDIMDTPPENIRFQGENIVYMDLEAMRFPLVIRNSIPGDRIQPLGMEGVKKLKNYFIDIKIPQRDRRKIPVMADDHEVLWIVGMRLSERVKITDKTKKVVQGKIV